MHAKEHACIDQGFVRPAMKYRSEWECTVLQLCVDNALLPWFSAIQTHEHNKINQTDDLSLMLPCVNSPKGYQVHWEKHLTHAPFSKNLVFQTMTPFLNVNTVRSLHINRAIFRVECTLCIWPAHTLFSLTVVNSYFGKQREWLTIIILQTAPQHTFHYSHRFPVSAVNDSFK